MKIGTRRMKAVTGMVSAFLAWQTQAGCVSDSLLEYVDTRAETAITDRWERIGKSLREQPGGMPLSEAGEIHARRQARNLPVEHMDEVIAAMKCLTSQEVEDEQDDDSDSDLEDGNDSGDGGSNGGDDGNAVVVPDEPDAGQPQQEPDRSAIGNFRAYYATGVNLAASSNVAWEMDEDDWWEAKLILSYKVTFDSSHHTSVEVQPQRFCIAKQDYRDDNYNSPGPISLSGFTETVQYAPDSVCTKEIYDSTLNTTPNAGWRNESADGKVEVSFETRLRIRDNNVVQDDFPIAELNFHPYGIFDFNGNLTINGQAVGGTSGILAARPDLYRPEVTEEPDRMWWRMYTNAEAFPDSTHETFCLGTGSYWDRFTPLQCGHLRASKYLDRAPVVNGSCSKTHADYVVRADVSEADWIPDNCFPTKQEVDFPLSASNTPPALIAPNRLPTITEDDVSWFDLSKQNGKWTIRVSKPVVVTDGSYWSNTSEGMTLKLRRDTWTLNFVDVLIPAENGIVKDIDYVLDDLKLMNSSARPPAGWKTWKAACASSGGEGFGAAGFQIFGGNQQSYVQNNDLTSQLGGKYGLDMDLPPNGSDLCR